MEEAAHKLVVHSLFSKDSPQGHIRDYFRKLEEANKNKGQQSEYAKQYAWVPPGLQQGVVSVCHIRAQFTTIYLQKGAELFKIVWTCRSQEWYEGYIIP